MSEKNRPHIGIGFRPEVYRATAEHLDRFDTLEIIVDHYLAGGTELRRQIVELSERLPVVGHGVCLSLATAVAPDKRYLDQVAEVLDIVKAPSHSEHLAFTKVPGIDLAQLMPVPRTRAVAEVIVRNLGVVCKHIHLPFAIENITYYFEYPESEMTEPEFIALICREANVSLLLDLENLYLNSCNHRFDPYAYIDSLPPNLVRGVHVAGGITMGPLMLDSHDKPVPQPVFDLLGYLLARQNPETIVLERDDELDNFDQLLGDVERLRSVVAGSRVVLA